MLGDRLHKHLETAVISSDFRSSSLAPDSVLSRWVDEEWRLKYEQQLEGTATRVIPVLLEDCDVPPTLKGRLMLRCKTTSELLRRGFLELDAAVQTLRGPAPLSAQTRSNNMNMELSEASRMSANTGRPTISDDYTQSCSPSS